GGFTFSSENFRVGDLVKVMQVVKDRDKERTQIFEGKIIAIRGRAPNTTFTVRKIGVNNIGVERIFPLYSPTISKIVLKKSMPAKKAKLYHLRSK
ncbi:MAG: 50S ribosomal protein L19, partial [Minisyncoccales bacterium]